MTISSGVMQLVTQLQFIGMMTQIDVPWPTPWGVFTGYLDFTNIRFETIVGADKIPLFSFRMVFILISICVPLAINILLLIIFQPVYIVVWYCCLCLGIVALIVGLLGMYLPGSVDQSQANPMLFVIVGAALTGACLLALGIKLLVEKLLDNGLSQTQAFKEELRDMKKCHRVRALKHAAIFIFLALAGILIMGVLQATFPGNNTSSAWFTGSPIFFALGITLLCMSFLAFLYMILNWCRPGRRCVVAATIFFKKHILLLLLTGISASFIPVVSYAVDMFMCAEYTCPVGTKFNPYAQRSTGSYDTSESRYCDPCNFTTTMRPMCGVNVSGTFEWCPAFSDLRSWRNPDTTCSDEATVYFYLAAIVVLVMYMVGIPALFMRIIQQLTDNIRTRAIIGPVQEEETHTDIWVRQIAAVEPAAASLYDAFKYERRFYMLVQLAYRLLVTMTFNVAAAYSDAAVIIILVLHTLSCILVSVFQPYLSFVEQVLAICLCVCNMLNATYAIILWTEGNNIPFFVAWIFIVCNGVIPGVAIIVAGLYGRAQRKKMAQENEARVLQQNLIDIRSATVQPDNQQDKDDSSGDEEDDADLIHASPSRPAGAGNGTGATDPYSEEMATKKTAAPLPPARGTLDPDGAASSDSFSESFDRSYDDTVPIMLPSQQREAREQRRREQQQQRREEAEPPAAVASAVATADDTPVVEEIRPDPTAEEETTADGDAPQQEAQAAAAAPTEATEGVPADGEADTTAAVEANTTVDGEADTVVAVEANVPATAAVSTPAAAETTAVNAEAKKDDSASDVADEDEARLDAIVQSQTKLTKGEKKRLKRIMKKRAGMNDDVTNAINQASTDTMNKAFMLMGIFFLVAFGISFLGLMRASPQEFLVGSSYFYRGKGTVLAGYDNWDEFIGKCCCIPQTTPSPDFDVAERWICENGKVLERGRVSGEDNGLPIRDVCGTAFKDSCYVKDNIDTGVLELTCATGTPAYLSTTDTARELLW